MTTLTVELGERSYPIYISPDLLKDTQTLRQHLSGQKVVVVTNTLVRPLWALPLLEQLTDLDVTVIELPDGEQHKTLQSFEFVMTELLSLHAARDTTLIAIGGGVIGDLTGFVAACYQRGVPFIQVPTTLLSQVDSSVGGKTAVNHPLGKNMIGAFYQPKAVLIDTRSLATLPAREFAAGMAEVIKYGVIYDKSFFAWLEDNVEQLKALNQDAISHAIYRCCEIKATIVAQDEKEGGIRALLNLGHTFGHAIEAEQGYGNWLHGEAVAAGIVLAAQTSIRKNWLNASEVCRIENLLKAFDLPITAPGHMNFDIFMKHMRHDKKVKAGRIRFVLPQGIGHAVVSDEVSDDILKEVLGEH